MKTKGFTLIELLAVIVLLGIIALISVPMIVGVIEKSKKGTAKTNALNYIGAVEQWITSENFNKNEIANGGYYTQNLIDVSIKGTVPDSNSWITIQDGKIVKAQLKYDPYVLEYFNEEIHFIDTLGSIENEVNQIIKPKNVAFLAEHGDNKEIVSTYFDVQSAVLEKPICKIGNTVVSMTEDVVKLGINETYQVTCTVQDKSATIPLKIANRLYLYKDGNEFTDLTGGWILNTIKNTSRPWEGDSGGGTFTKNPTNMTFINSESNVLLSKRVMTKNKLDFSSYKKITSQIDYHSERNTGSIGNDRHISLGFISSITNSATVTPKAVSYLEENQSPKGNLSNTVYDQKDAIISLALDENDNSLYPAIMFYTAGSIGNQSMTIHQVWLEK